MLRRITAYALCFSLIGLTAMPASYLPCCCKNMRAPIPEKKTPCCCQHGAQTMAGSSFVHRQMASADVFGFNGSARASAMSANGGACCPSKALKKTCPICRCLEQMQVIALAGSGLTETTIRMSADTVPTVDAPAISRPNASAEVLRLNQYPPGIMITLQTCSLRC